MTHLLADDSHEISSLKDCNSRNKISKCRLLQTIGGASTLFFSLFKVDQETPPPAVSARVLQLQTGCQKLRDEGLTPDRIVNSKLNHLIVNDKHKVLYCFVPKVACTNLKRVFLLLTGKMNETEPLKLKANDVHTIYTKYFHLLHQDSEEDIKFKIKHYRKIVFVREPLERLLSAYRNKFIQVQEGGFYFKEQFGKQIIKRYRVNASAESLRRGHDVKFNEFVQYLLDTPVKSFNEHWASISSLCFPCHIAYDFIGKYETLHDDVTLLLKEMSLDGHISFPKRNESYNYEPTEDIMMEYFRRIPRQSLNPLWKIYHQDCILFGYQFPSIIKKLLDVPQTT